MASDELMFLDPPPPRRIETTDDLRQQFELRAQTGNLAVHCPMFGSINAEIAVVAEAPGNSEVAQRVPLIGGSGKVLWDVLRGQGILRTECYVTNVCKRQVSFGDDDARHPINRYELDHWVDLLRWELSQLPNVKYVLALGNYALRALTGHDGITSWRGSVLPIQLGDGRTVHCVCTVNPAMVVREPKTEIVFRLDCHKLTRLRKGEWKHHRVDAIINPSPGEAIAYLDRLHATASPISFDIETVAGETACVGFANNAHDGMCINFRTRTENRYSLSEERQVRRAIQRLLASPTVKLIAQNGNFDSYWLWYKDRIRVKPIWFDTMLAHHTLYNSLPHNLGFLTTQYTDHPYYKDEKDNWRDDPTKSIDEFWEYNVKDCALTWAVHLRMREELRKEQLDKFFFEHVMRIQPHLVRMTVGGVKVDVALKEKIAANLVEDIHAKLAAFHEATKAATGDGECAPNPKSPKQMSELYFSRLKLVGRGTSTDATNRQLMYNHPRTSESARAVIRAHDDYLEEHKFLSTYANADVDEDGRIRCEYKQTGVSSAPGRLSSSSVMWGSGMNLQNQPSRSQPMFIADPGYGFFYIDLSQAEARVVAWLAPIPLWIEQFERARLDGKYDCHRALASDMFKVPYDEVPTFDRYDEDHLPPPGKKIGDITIRFTAKRCRHGLNYRMGPDRLSLTTGLSRSEALFAYDTYHRITPELRKWWYETEMEVKQHRALFNAYGRRMTILERLTPEALESIVAYKPQSTIGDKINRVIYKSHDDPRWPSDARIALNIHDAIIGIAPLDKRKECLRIVIKHAEEPLLIKGRELIIPADAALSEPDEWGMHRWSTIKKVKRDVVFA